MNSDDLLSEKTDSDYTNNTCSTRGDVTFDDLCRGLKISYCLDRLVSLLKEDNSPMSFFEAEKTLSNHVKTILEELELQLDKRIIKYTIGKTYARRRRRAGRHYIKFNPMNAKTWRLDSGANGRWHSFYKSEGYDGLVVLCAARKEEIPRTGIKISPQNYAFALEQRLIHHFVFTESDTRIGNISFASGGHADEKSVKAGLVYLAFKHSEKTADQLTSKQTTSQKSHFTKEQLPIGGKRTDTVQDWLNRSATVPDTNQHVQPNECSQVSMGTDSPLPPDKNEVSFSKYIDTDTCQSRTCHKPEGSSTIVCENDECSSWIHETCINEPDTLSWFCEKCKASRLLKTTNSLNQGNPDGKMDVQMSDTVGFNLGDVDQAIENIANPYFTRQSSRQNDKEKGLNTESNEEEIANQPRYFTRQSSCQNDSKKPFSCDLCSKSFNQIAHLRTHKRTHTGEKPYRCGTCGESFRRSHHLKQHEMIHTGEKPFKCNSCRKAFRQSHHLKQHMRIHTGEKPYTCDICGQCFRQNHHLKKHIERNHFAGKII